VVAVKALHTVVYLAVEACVAVVLADGVRGRGGRRAAVAGGIVAVETGVFLALGGRCPLTGAARRLGNPEGADDIYLPGWFARNLAMLHAPVVALALRLHLPVLMRAEASPGPARRGPGRLTTGGRPRRAGSPPGRRPSPPG
jgi:hypothetical protein